ncbi:MAG: tetratricopeptide repeat protein [bacterium]|nr:tetratricopeptide repeat protein [bacterium]
MGKNNYFGHRLCALLLFAAASSVFLNTFKGEFVYDDLVVVMNNPGIAQWNFWHGWGVMGRFTRSLTLMLDYMIFGSSPYGYHLQNILWHALSTLLLYRVFIRLSNDRSVSFLGAIFFALHPIHVESVANISNRKDLICMSFSLLSFLSYINFMERERRAKWFVLVLATWFLALNSKEVAIILPLSFLIYEFLYLPKDNRWLLKRPVILFVVVAAGAFLVLMYILTVYQYYGKSVVDFSKVGNILTLGGHRGDVTYFSVASTSARAFWDYIKLLLFPFNLSPDYIIELSTPFVDPALIFLWCMQILFIFSPFYFAKKNPLVAFGLFWFLIHYIPISNLLPIAYIVADRYMYIPSAGFCLVLAACCISIYRGVSLKAANVVLKSFVIVLICLMITGYSVTTFIYNSVWRDEETLWSHAVLVSPMSYKAHNNLGEVYIKKGYFQKAIKEFDQSLSIFSISKTYVNRGNAFAYLGKYGEAVADYSKAIALAPKLAEAYYGVGTVYIDMKEFDRAIDSLSEAVAIDPDFEQAHNNLGNAYNHSGNLPEALNSYSRAIELNPLYAVAYKNRAYTYMSIKNYSQAIKDYKKAIELGLVSAGIYYNVGMIYSELRDSENAYSFYKKAASMGDRRAIIKAGSFKEGN